MMFQLGILPLSQLKAIQLYFKLYYEHSQNVSDSNRGTNRPRQSLSAAPQCPVPLLLVTHIGGCAGCDGADTAIQPALQFLLCMFAFNVFLCPRLDWGFYVSAT